MAELEPPYTCPSCEINLQERGAVYGWVELPERFVGHIEPGVGEGVILVIDGTPYIPEIKLQCGDCGADIDLKVEEKYLDPEVEITEDDENSDFVNAES